ncbi:hypothetical protein ANO11243_008470 [Dothideomycetidae sp. 11243]|nr:hypothetical protein ANO11243_008470 [fungal sp. No.11243]
MLERRGGKSRVWLHLSEYGSGSERVGAGCWAPNHWALGEKEGSLAGWLAGCGKKGRGLRATTTMHTHTLTRTRCAVQSLQASGDDANTSGRGKTWHQMRMQRKASENPRDSATLGRCLTIAPPCPVHTRHLRLLRPSKQQ